MGDVFGARNERELAALRGQYQADAARMYSQTENITLLNKLQDPDISVEQADQIKEVLGLDNHMNLMTAAVTAFTENPRNLTATSAEREAGIRELYDLFTRVLDQGSPPGGPPGAGVWGPATELS